MAILAVLLWPLLWYWGRKARPKTKGTTTVPGLEDRVKVLWDAFAIPHVFASNEHDLFMAEGYLHAQERLSQMDFTRRFLTGRLAEILGERSVPWREVSFQFKGKTIVDLDHFVRLIGIRRTACASLALLPPHLSGHLEAYSEGVNRYIETHFNSLPVEFRLLRYHPDPWRPEDSLTIAKGFALLLSTSLLTRLTLYALSDRLVGQEAKLRSLFPVYPDWAAPITRYQSSSTQAQSQSLLRFVNGTFGQSQWAPIGQGSNNWAIAPWKSSTAKAVLCNDPHLRMSLPPVWYLMQLEAGRPNGHEPSFQVWGASIPGCPYIQLGHNSRISWGVTAALCDDADLYRERIHPRDTNSYLIGDEWKKMELREEDIQTRRGRHVKRTIRFTRHGPVISDFTETSPVDEVLSFRWTGHDPGEELRSLYGINRAQNWSQFLESLSHQITPTLNYVYADSEGNIGYSLAGRIPLRPSPPSLLPLPGWSEDFDWKGYVPFSELPRLFNPPEGIIATANNRVTDSSYPYHLSDLFDAPYRIGRIKELLSAKDRLSPDGMADVQADVVSIQARELIQVLEGSLRAIARRDSSYRESVEALTQWNGNCSADSPQAALFHVLYHRLMVNLLEPDLGQDLWVAYAEIYNQSLIPMDQILRDPGSPWFLSRSRQSLLEQSLREAKAEIASKLGNDPEKWTWGKIHSLTLDHPLGRVKALAPFFSIGPFPSSGDGVTINTGFYRHSHPFRQVVGPSLRMILCPGAWDRSRYILPSGQSGHPLSTHYRDQVELWRRGEYVRLDYAKKEMEHWPVLTLTPMIAP